MAEEAQILTVGALVVAAALAHVLAKAARAPPAPFFIAAGFGARFILPSGGELLEGLLVLSLVFLLFAAGVHLNPPRFPRATLGRVATFGLLGGGLIALAAGGLAHAAGWSPRAVPYVAFAAGASSTLIVLALLADRREVADSHGRLLVGGLLVQDAAALVLFTLVPNLPDAPRLAAEQLFAISALAVLAVALTRVARSHVPWRIVRGAEPQTLLAFGVLFAFVLLASALRAPLAAGALLAGLTLAPFPANVHARPAIRAARDFFTPVFFVVLGAVFPLPAREDVPFVLAFVGLVLVVKPLVLALIARALSFTRRTSATAGVLASQSSEFALVLVLAGAFAGDLTAHEFGVLGLAVALTMLVSPLLPRRAVDVVEALLPADPAPPAVPESGHVIVLGVGRTGERVVELLREDGIVVVGVDADPHALARLPSDAPRVHGDATSTRVLDAARVQHARAVVILLTGDEVTITAAHRASTRLPAGAHGVIARAHSDTTTRTLTVLGASALRPRDALDEALDRALTRALHAGDG